MAGLALALLVGLGTADAALGDSASRASVSAVACLVMARSASGVAIAVVTTAFILLVVKGRGLARTGVTAAVCLLGLVAALNVGGLASGVASLLGRDASFSGRTAIWQASFPAALQQPLIGAGYDYTGSPDYAARLRGLFSVYSVHSGYLDALISLGFVLCSLMAVAVLLVVWRAWRRPVWSPARRAVATALLVGGLLSAVTEAGITHPSGPMQMLWLLALFGLFASV